MPGESYSNFDLSKYENDNDEEKGSVQHSQFIMSTNK